MSGKLKMLEPFRIIDLTQPLFRDAPTWGGSCGFCLEMTKDYDQLFRVNRLKMDAGIGTHMDAPCHLIKGGLSIEQMQVTQFITQVCIIDVSTKADADYEISVDDIEMYERMYGLIPKGSVVIAYTGWCRFWTNATAYRNQDAKGQMHFPAFSSKAAEVLLERDVAGIAIDTLSPDCLDLSFAVHKLLLGSGKYIIENIGDCSQVPAKGAYIIALPLKIQDCSESPLRVVALIPHKEGA